MPPGGPSAEVAFTDRRLDGGTGPNGVAVTRDGRALVFAQTQMPGAAPGVGKLYALEIAGDRDLRRLREIYTSRPNDGPDGFAIGRSGRF